MKRIVINVAICSVTGILLGLGIFGIYKYGYEKAKTKYTNIYWQSKEEIEDITEFKGMPWCRHKVVYQALIFGEHYPVRLVVGPGIDIEGRVDEKGSHVQAQAYIEGEWQWLQQREGRVYVGGKDWYFSPFYYMDLGSYVAKQIKKFNILYKPENKITISKITISKIDCSSGVTSMQVNIMPEEEWEEEKP